MPSLRDLERELVADVRDLARDKLPMPVLFAQLRDRLREVVGFDAGCWHGADPVTGFVTSTVSDGLDLSRFEQAVHIELWSDDPLTFERLRRSGRGADSVTRATHGRPERSVRYRELLTEMGYGDEMRLNFDAQGGRWGAAALMRAPDRGPYRAEELRLVETFTRHVGMALRSCYQPAGSQPETALAVTVLGPNGQVAAADQQAQALLAELGEHSGLLTVAEQARGAGGAPAMARLRAPNGRWLMLHASLLQGGDEGRVAVVARPAAPAEVMPIALMTYGLTSREQEVARAVLRGNSTKEIAGLLTLTPVTVQDHLRSVFTKTGVRSRRELIALFMAL
ncbi:helix-turn-helix transcriptional regulator [Actinocrispum wychmicini]|uniref:helix-turn-helix transcriptional regulator n=1 Tax=Actinocrispum wychmicini TaxID=1213861 RepID=UPI00104D6C05|nr:helix-turn-helix transcriptional regulator [Actinocrispum wychmicini]